MTLVVLKDVRLAFPAIWEPESVNGSAEKFGGRFILPPKHPGVKLIRDTIKAVAKAKWGPKADGILRSIDGDKMKICWQESDYMSQDGEVHDGFEGMYHLSTKSEVQPTIVDKDRTPLSKRDGRPYGGCYVVARVDIYAQDNIHGKAIRAQLQGLQYLRKGDSFGGGTKANPEDFEDLSDYGNDDEDEMPSRATASRRPVEDDFDDVA